MGKYASREAAAGTPVAWGDITGKPVTFTPASHNNTAHSTEYAPAANPTLTGQVMASNAGCTAATPSTYQFSVGISGVNKFTIGADANYSYIQSWAGKPLYLNNQGNDVYVGASLIAAALKTANWSFEEQGNDLLLVRGSTVLFRFGSTGAFNNLGEQESGDPTP